MARALRTACWALALLVLGSDVAAGPASLEQQHRPGPQEEDPPGKRTVNCLGCFNSTSGVCTVDTTSCSNATKNDCGLNEMYIDGNPNTWPTGGCLVQVAARCLADLAPYECGSGAEKYTIHANTTDQCLRDAKTMGAKVCCLQ